MFENLKKRLDFRKNIDLFIREVKEETFEYKLIFFSSLIDEKDEFLNISIENNKDLEISLGLIINRNVTTKNLTKEIFEAINFNIKKNKIYTLKKLNVYVKGVK